MKAWFLENRDGSGEPYNEIIHAETRGKAITGSELYLMHELDFTEIKATRLPGMDGREVTDRNVWLDGLMVYCLDCGNFAMGQDGGDPLFDEGENAYCYGCFPAKEKLKNVVN